MLDLAREKGLIVVEDAAQAHGAVHEDGRCGTMGVASGFSFYPGKNLGAYGDAGAVVTDSMATAELVRSISHHGMGEDRYQHVRFGCTSRLDTVQALVLRAKLARLALTDAELDSFAGQLDAILTHVSQIQAVDVTGVEQLVFALAEAADVLRPVEASDRRCAENEPGHALRLGQREVEREPEAAREEVLQREAEHGRRAGAAWAV